MSTLQIIAGARAGGGGTVGPLLTAIEALALNGLIVRTGASSAEARTITGTANRVVVTNGDGVSGNPTLDVGTDVVVLGGTQTITGAKTFSTDLTLSGAPGKIKPAVNSTTALQMTNAAGTAVMTVNTTNSRVGVGVTAPAVTFEASAAVRASNSSGASYIQIAHDTFNPSLSFSGGNGFLFFTPDAVNRAFVPLTNNAYELGLPSKLWATVYTYRVVSLGGALTVGTQEAQDFTLVTNNTARITIKTTSGNVGIGTTSPSALLHAVIANTTTNAVTNVGIFGHNASGTIGDGIGTGVVLQTQTSTNANTQIARWTAELPVSTDAIFTSRVRHLANDKNGEREYMSGGANGSAPILGVLGATPVIRQAHIADPSGGATVDAEARTAINAILAAFETFGFLATS